MLVFLLFFILVFALYRLLGITYYQEAELEQREIAFLDDMLTQNAPLLQFEGKTLLFIQGSNVIDRSNSLPSQYYVKCQSPPRGISLKIALARSNAVMPRWLYSFRMRDFRVIQFENWISDDDVIISVSDVSVSNRFVLIDLVLTKQLESDTHRVFRATRIGGVWSFEAAPPGSGTVTF